MKKLTTSLILILLAVITSCNSDNKNLNSDNKKPYSDYPVVLDTIFSYENQKLNLVIRIREDLHNRQIYETYQCDNETLITKYGNEFIIQLFEEGNHSYPIFRNFINFKLIKKLDKKRKIENHEILGSEINFEGVKNNSFVLTTWSHYPVGEGSNFIRLGFDIKKPDTDYCDLGGITLIDITSLYDL